MHDQAVLKIEESKAMERSSRTVPLLFIGGGALLLVANLLHIHLIEYLWPGFIIGPAILMLWPSYRSTEAHRFRLSFLAIPGSFLLATGLILVITNLTGYYDSWAYAWPLLLAGIAAGVSYWKRFDPAHRVHHASRRFVRAMVMVSLILMAFFELLIFQSLGPWWPLVLVGYGVYQYRRHQ